ncbi:NAD(P)-dependent alcohol dehydrogenase [Planosporangium flavigriseum]|uniref:NADPH:quinone reductase n=1 Tax=Planosporangium flavigriseum TaxID=373681 RepID=A0A8J3PNU0_9ACTN|nr:NAD(P)-dependent alcohol dehydrogenase [Planosporangium flavigriseum]NJC67262.1 NAD(P)-dependent alcohol dehydrogenase [Planosporangium flavigriseum]GIG75228.1 NADPH:quinone reductase [Planosporangium flavigriseum]
MKAVIRDRYGSEDVLRCEDVPAPTAKDGEVLVRIHAAGVDQGVWHLMTGLPYLGRVAFGLRRPRGLVLGMDLAGRVEAVGVGVTRFRPGDEVFGSYAGAYAEYACGPQERFAPKPAGLTFEQAAAVPISAVTALQGLRGAGRVQPGQAVLVIGAGGGVGSFAVQLAKVFGAHVTAVCSGGKADLVRSIGADDVIDYTRLDITDGGRRYDVILDVAGNRPLRQLRRALAPQGTLVVAGGEGGGPWLGGVDRQLRAQLLSPFVRQNLRALMSRQRLDDLLLVRDLLESGAITPVVDRVYALSEVPEAIRYLRSGHARGKVVIAV